MQSKDRETQPNKKQKKGEGATTEKSECTRPEREVVLITMMGLYAHESKTIVIPREDLTDEDVVNLERGNLSYIDEEEFAGIPILAELRMCCANYHRPEPGQMERETDAVDEKKKTDDPERWRKWRVTSLADACDMDQIQDLNPGEFTRMAFKMAVQ